MSTLRAYFRSSAGCIVMLFAAASPATAECSPHSEVKLLDLRGISDQSYAEGLDVDGRTAIIGARSEDSDAGSAYVYIRPGDNWLRQARLTALDAAPGDLFGTTVALSGDTAVIGAHSSNPGGFNYAGAAYVFIREGAAWSQQAKLTASDISRYSHFGRGVDLLGETAAIGAPETAIGPLGGAGAIYIFVRRSGLWSEQAKLSAADAGIGDWLGFSVALENDLLVAGAFYDRHSGLTGPGSAYVFVRNGETWSQEAKLIASDPGLGNHFGRSVAISGDTIVVGAYNNDHSGLNNAGAAYVFVRANGQWVQQAKMIASDASESDSFGSSVAVLGSMAAIGASMDSHSGSQDAGSAYIFSREGAAWTERVKLIAADNATTDNFGSSIALAGGVVAVGAPSKRYMGRQNVGAAYLYQIDCNLNERLDCLDIEGGSSTDVNGNGVPDDCEDLCTPPNLTLQPVSTTVCEGDTVVLRVDAAALPNPVYQWRRSGVGLLGATRPTLAIPAALPSDSDIYDVEIRNACGSATSDAAVVQIWPIGSGDVNGDGAVNGEDIGSFVNVVLQAPSGPAELSNCAADMNRDGSVDLRDAIIFIVALLH